MRLCQLPRSWMLLYYYLPYLQILPGVYVNVLLLLLSLVLRHQHSDIEHCLLLVFLSFSPSSHTSHSVPLHSLCSPPLTLFPSSHSLLPILHYQHHLLYIPQTRHGLVFLATESQSQLISRLLPATLSRLGFVRHHHRENRSNHQRLRPSTCTHLSIPPFPPPIMNKTKGQTNPFHFPPNSPADSPPSSGPSAVPSSTPA